MTITPILGPLPLEPIFIAANIVATLCWVALIALPRKPLTYRIIVWVVAIFFCVPYTALLQVYFFRNPDAGFESIQAVQALLSSPEMVLAIWLHIFAFDLFVGAWIAKKSDTIGLSRWIQAPILLLTFMAGPSAFLFFCGVLLLQRRQNTEGGVKP